MQQWLVPPPPGPDLPLILPSTAQKHPAPSCPLGTLFHTGLSQLVQTYPYQVQIWNGEVGRTFLSRLGSSALCHIRNILGQHKGFAPAKHTIWMALSQ